ncbi:hypothetical protein KC360_g4816 [Hortaea werneckii]|nr:hypothetical protein KC361_g5497 [Hortaea werneckii]KAI6883851.1 hypothetical protein KC325_g4768 [Hortaea werneckii]KAI6992773.1 hypothetical protein KC359_g5497 [Hortaea werneckii]KAI7145158.1 hypothetical protein KC344_g4736 [Hortaea werneckii]KAI7173575.1 hypothetical protein KC360_g4816 [Hortaea werneckii]
MMPLLPTLLILPLAFGKEVHISVNSSSQHDQLPPIARFFGADEPNYAYYPHGELLLHELGVLNPNDQTYFRTHNLLTTCEPLDDITPRLKWGCTDAYTEDPSTGQAVYNWTIIDRIFDAYLARHVKPYVQIGFMPKALAREPVEPYTFDFDPESAVNEIFTGWTHGPTSYEKWGELVYTWVRHEVELRGEREVESWYWEVWNEANIGYWNGTEQEYFELYDYAVENVRRALPGARVGGPEVAGGPDGEWLGLFLNHTIDGTNAVTRKDEGSPLDFISFHAKGAPIYVNGTAEVPGHLQMNASASLQNSRDAFSVISSYPELKGRPVIIGEDDPDGCAACVSDAYDYRNGLIYPSYTAEVFVRNIQLAREYGVNLEGAVTWAFEFENHAYFDGYRVLATNGIDKPILNIFRMFGMLTGQRVASHSSGEIALDTVVQDSVVAEPDVGVLATFNETTERLAVMVWHYHDDDLPKPDADITIDVAGLAERAEGGWRGCWSWHGWRDCEKVQLTHYRIDNDHSNSYTKWLAIGSPQEPTAEQYADLQAAGKLQMLGRPQHVAARDGKVEVKFSLPLHAVSLLIIERR